MILTQTFAPDPTAVGGSIVFSALIAFIPLLLFFVLLGAFKVPTHWCSIISLIAALLVAVFGFRMPATLAGLSALQGMAFGLFPILYIVIMAVWLYNLTESSGRAADVQAIFSAVGRGDKRVQALLLGYAFCGLLEGLAGFGAPVAIACAMLIALDVPPIRAALAVMVGNALNVGFGAMAIPVTTVARLGGNVPADAVGATMGRIAPLLIFFVPFFVLAIIDGARGLKQVWPVALAAGAGMSVGHVVTSNFISYELTAVLASLLSLSAVIAVLRVWQPTTPDDQASAPAKEKVPGGRAVLGLLPYLLVVVILSAAKLIKVPTENGSAEILARFDTSFGWPGLHGNLLDAQGNVATSTIFNLNWASSPGTMLLLTGLIVSAVYGLNSSGGRFEYSFGRGIATLGSTISSLKVTILTIAMIMGLAYVMNFSGQTLAIGQALAATGAAFAFLSPFLGWIGTAVTGSATSTAALFGNLQATAATNAGIDPHLLLSVNEVGGGIGKIVSPQNLAIAAGAIKTPGSEPELLRKGAVWSGILVVSLAVITVLASSGCLSFLVVS